MAAEETLISGQKKSVNNEFSAALLQSIRPMVYQMWYQCSSNISDFEEHALNTNLTLKSN